MNKDKILETIINEFENNIKELNNSLEDYKAASNLDEGDTMDPEDYSQQSEQKEMQYQMQLQLDKARAGLNRVKEFAGKQFSTAKSGALVETDKNWILLGISIPSLKIGDKDLFGISPESPAFNIINGKSTGDTIKLGQHHYTIIGIH